MQNNHNVRWAFNASAWAPTEQEIFKASSFIQLEEKDRISRFVFVNDAKSSLLGRLMMRRFVNLSTSMPYNEIKFGRDCHGKPYLLGAGDIPLSFNISHQGDYVVLAGNTMKNIGVDIMKIEPPANKNIPEFFRLMNRQFSAQEWETIHKYSTEMEQVACFYRNWCLKESYVKNTGFGITVPLQEISFSIKTLNVEVGKFVTDTTLYIRGILKYDWIFEETMLDDQHSVAVSIQTEDCSHLSSEPFKLLSFEELIEEAVPLCESDSKFSSDFVKKQLKSF
jgi:phosphopantetheine--protein transferase-like protein